MSVSRNNQLLSATMSEKTTQNAEPTTAPAQGQVTHGAGVSDQSLAGEPMETDTTALLASMAGVSNVRPAGRMRPANGFFAAREKIFLYVMHAAREKIFCF